MGGGVRAQVQGGDLLHLRGRGGQLQHPGGGGGGGDPQRTQGRAGQEVKTSVRGPQLCLLDLRGSCSEPPRGTKVAGPPRRGRRVDGGVIHLYHDISQTLLPPRDGVIVHCVAGPRFVYPPSSVTGDWARSARGPPPMMLLRRWVCGFLLTESIGNVLTGAWPARGTGSGEERP